MLLICEHYKSSIAHIFWLENIFEKHLDTNLGYKNPLSNTITIFCEFDANNDEFERSK